jgi:hypothetical protein
MNLIKLNPSKVLYRRKRSEVLRVSLSGYSERLPRSIILEPEGKTSIKEEED